MVKSVLETLAKASEEHEAVHFDERGLPSMQEFSFFNPS
jgi:hypothetical protein